MRYRSLFDRLVANTKVDEHGCWIWTGRTNGRYPVFTMRVAGKHKLRYAHRTMLELVTGYEFPFDQAGHYRCYKTLCIKPGCLRIQTHAENQSERPGYGEVSVGRWIPVLFPTARRLEIEAIDAHLEWCETHPGTVLEECPF